MGSKLFIMEEKDLEEIVLEGLRIEAIEKEKAAERKSLTRKNGLKPDDAKYTQDSSGQTRDIVASHLNMSGKQWDRMKYIYRFKDIISEETYTSWCKGKISTSKLYNEIRQDIAYSSVLGNISKLLSEIQRDVRRHERSRIYQDIKSELLYDMRIINNDKSKNKICSHLDELEIDNKCFMSETYDKISIVQHQIDKLMKKTKN